ncbi:MAG: alcohol dehydrogenase catalytic domain-containing protein, partial [Nitrospira sp.]|nr:alcohol dehydrogenase catalytic domain-containing protein [Nitrospira sp.]
MFAVRFDTQLQLDHDAPRPEPCADEAIIRVLRAGICSTDLELCKGYMEYSGILGHEFVGIVEQTDGGTGLEGCRVVGEINA